MIKSGTQTYTYDAENRMTATAGVNYDYDGDGRRVKKSNGTLYWHGVSGNVLLETDSAGNSPEEFVFFDGQRVARRDGPGNIYYYFEDHLGTSRIIAQADGQPCYDADFYPFGGERVYLDTCPQSYKFTGKERDAESGLDYFGARHYASALGRFNSIDPVLLGKPLAGIVTNPQRWNGYAYAINNPLQFIDSTGRFSTSVHDRITSDGARAKGYSEATVKTLVDANRDVDRRSNFFNNPEHGMTNPFSRDAAGAIINAIESRKEEAVQRALQGDYKGSTEALGAALHTVQDFVAHEGRINPFHLDFLSNDKDEYKLANAERQSTQFLSEFESAIIKAVGPEKGQEIIDNVKRSGDPVLQKKRDGGQGDKLSAGCLGLLGCEGGAPILVKVGRE